MLIRDRRSYDFTITRSFMKLFRTGSVTVVTDRQKFSLFLPVTYQTVRFLQKFQSSDNHVCNLFSKKAEIGVKSIFSQYGSQIHNVYDLKNTEYTFFGNKYGQSCAKMRKCLSALLMFVCCCFYCLFSCLLFFLSE